MPERTFKLLEVDLTNKKTQTLDVTEEVKKFLGGRSLGSKLLWDRVPPGADPLGHTSAARCLRLGTKPERLETACV